jgi:hypothetical protein
MNSVKKLVVLMCLSMPAWAHAGEAVVKWHDFNDYRDVRASNQTKSSYHKHIANSIEKHVAKLAEQLPSAYKLSVEITELDLAGDVHFGGTNEIRVVKPIYFPQLQLNYSLKNDKGEVMGEGSDIELKDMGFMNGIKRGRDEPFYYEKRLLTEWFDEQVLAQLE